MDILDKIASAHGRQDQILNQELARQIADGNDKKAIGELVEGLQHKKTAVRGDCIKVLYEVGYSNPELIAPHISAFLELLKHKDNRLQWGAMTALDTIAPVNPELVYQSLPEIISVADNGSVITKDHAVGILIQLGKIAKYANEVFALLNEQLLKSPTNQLPKYAENAMPLINGSNRDTFIRTLTSRLDDIAKDTKRKRLEKVISKMKKK